MREAYGDPKEDNPQEAVSMSGTKKNWLNSTEGLSKFAIKSLPDSV